MSQTLQLSIRGLYTYSSELAGIPAGALSVALNVNISRLNIVEPRRGFNFLTYALPADSDRAKKLVFYQSSMFAHFGTTFSYYDSGAGFSSRGSITTPTNATSIRTAAISKNLYLTSSVGLKKMDDITASVYNAGLPKGTFIEGATSGSTGTAVAASNYVAYRYVVGTKDANDLLILGGVSAMYTHNNGEADIRNIDLTVYIPDGLSTSHFIQVYRSKGSSAIPNGELQLAYEYSLTSANITNGYFTVSDIVPDDLLGAYLYTASSQEGIANDNYEPPLASDIAVYENRLFYADTISKHRFKFSLIACGGSLGLAVDDTITVTDGTTTEVYTAKGTYNGTNKHFVVDTATASLATRISDTSYSLAKLINSESALINAYLLMKDGEDLPGQILLEEKSLGGVQLTITSSQSTAFSPKLEAVATDSQKSSNDEFRNGLMFSKSSRPESVPLKNIFKVGSSDDAIKRIIPLRGGLFIFKEKEGIYVLRGSNEASFGVQLLDGTATLISPDSLQVVNNLIYGLFEAGVGQVSDTGVDFISEPIKDQLQTLLGDPLAATKAYSFGIASQTEGKYILACPVSSSDTYCKQQFIFDVFGRTWCKWDQEVACGGVNPEDSKLYFGPGDSSKIKIERKSYDYTDYADYNQLCTITSYSGATVTIDNTAKMAVGDYLVQDDLSAYIESVDLAAGTVTIDDEQAWTTSSADVEHLKAIDSQIEWNPDFASNPAGFKQFYEANLLFKQVFQKSATLSFYSDVDPSVDEIALTAQSGNGAWGQFDWGQEVWGGEGGKNPIRTGIPRSKARCNQLSVSFKSKVVYSDFQLNGVSLTFNPISSRTVR